MNSVNSTLITNQCFETGTNTPMLTLKYLGVFFLFLYNVINFHRLTADKVFRKQTESPLSSILLNSLSNVDLLPLQDSFLKQQFVGPLLITHCAESCSCRKQASACGTWMVTSAERQGWASRNSLGLRLLEPSIQSTPCKVDHMAPVSHANKQHMVLV